ncbi:MAG: ribbon-helix-helix protein, CopG family [Gammaproteobacteria bacterium]|nr:ribbon-helix-helix protein, CopG family [Gammaproteobacteria bacterium]
MANLSIRRLDEETVRRLKVRAEREGVSLEETVRRVLRSAVVDEEPLGGLIRRIVGKGLDLELAQRELDAPIDFASDDYLPDR